MKTKQTNRLIDEKSPYLLQHAYNPVDWFPWGQEAFDKAEAEGKPVFLSIGYSTCHWCHVMERESFEDEETAKILNHDFVSIKVDREERPDIDSVYMSACQVLAGQGGWPLSILMTPDQKPFFGGTYFPKTGLHGMPGFSDILKAAAKEWSDDKTKICEYGDKIVSLLKKNERISLKRIKETELSGNLFAKAEKMFTESYDVQNGGFGKSPKFPSAHNLLFLMELYATEKKNYCRKMAETTLRQMYKGGIFDHIGGGFSRYSTDKYWLAPHFEKMLYDNALLAIAYTEAHRIFKEPLYEDVVKGILYYVLREMTDKEGGFYTAQDADSEGIEGKYYLFTPKEIITVLGEEEGNSFCELFDITNEGNFEGLCIPNLLKAGDSDIGFCGMRDQKNKLYEYRLNRYSLHKDDKILTSWNGMAIAAFAMAYKEFNDRHYLDSAICANTFIQTKLMSLDGSLKVRYRNNEGSGKGFLDDYAYYIFGLLKLYEATGKDDYLDNALGYCRYTINHFQDKEHGGFYLTPDDGEILIVRPKDSYDGAIPSGNSVLAYCFTSLYQKTGNKEMKEMAEIQLKFLVKELSEYPAGYSFALFALSRYLNGYKAEQSCDNKTCNKAGYCGDEYGHTGPFPT